MKDRSGSALITLLITALILALLALFLVKQMKPSSSPSSPENTAVEEAQQAVDALNEKVTFSVIELPSMELLVLCPVRQLTGEQPQS